MKLVTLILIILAAIGILDAGYLVFEHYAQIVPPCSSSVLFLDCGKVLQSQYSTLFGIPVALLGLVHYTSFFVVLIVGFIFKRTLGRLFVIFLGTIGFLSSLYFVYLQVFVIGAFCFYCMVSALVSTLVFIISQLFLPSERKQVILFAVHKFYTIFLKRIFFLIDPEIMHVHMVQFGEFLGKYAFFKAFFRYSFLFIDPKLVQLIFGTVFTSPIGLSAGFDYEARLTQILPSLGFGFATVGTITNQAYAGNARPRLGRLPKSHALMVNKGFKNFGAEATANKLAKLRFQFPVGISIGRTNTQELKTIGESVVDIVAAFKTFERITVENKYYELNISCPNLSGNISFYTPKALTQLLTAVDKLKLSRPLFIKMPIVLGNAQVLGLLKVIARHSPQGVIFGNLQKPGVHAGLHSSEVNRFVVGGISGKPTFDRSNELIRLAYKNYKNRFVIIGCGGVFNGKDAYEKITAGATLVQLITGMIYEGPQLISKINFELLDLLDRDGYTHISQAIGSKN